MIIAIIVILFLMVCFASQAGGLILVLVLIVSCVADKVEESRVNEKYVIHDCLIHKEYTVDRQGNYVNNRDYCKTKTRLSKKNASEYPNAYILFYDSFEQSMDWSNGSYSSPGREYNLDLDRKRNLRWIEKEFTKLGISINYVDEQGHTVLHKVNREYWLDLMIGIGADVCANPVNLMNYFQDSSNMLRYLRERGIEECLLSIIAKGE